MINDNGAVFGTQNLTKIEQLIKQTRNSEIFRKNVPMEASTGFPIPLRKAGQTFIILPYFTLIRKMNEGIFAFPITSAITIEWPTGKLVNYQDLRKVETWKGVVWDRPVGKIPHEAIVGLTYRDVMEKRKELMSMYDQMFDKLTEGSAFSPEWEERFSSLLRLLMEPFLEKYYRAISPKFFEYFLPVK
ncbi:MAG: hypothetical protein N2645_01265 [Clostridia bacterium]|nr:hypothetical protein [Clostridia bacterium]